MTTPKKLKPGNVPMPAGWVGDAIPKAQQDAQSRAGLPIKHVPDLASVLPKYVDRAEFESWLDNPLGTYRAHALLVSQIPPLGADIEWLRDALRDLDRGDTRRLQNRGPLVMPGRTHWACFCEAYKAGLEWRTVLARKDIAKLRELTASAIAALQREQREGPSRKGPKTHERDKLLNAIIEKVMTYTRPVFLSSGKAVRRRVQRTEAVLVAANVLQECGVYVPSVTNAGHATSIKRAARRGKQ
jgi:hypothetical protein